MTVLLHSAKLSAILRCLNHENLLQVCRDFLLLVVCPTVLRVTRDIMRWEKHGPRLRGLKTRSLFFLSLLITLRLSSEFGVGGSATLSGEVFRCLVWTELCPFIAICVPKLLDLLRLSEVVHDSQSYFIGVW